MFKEWETLIANPGSQENDLRCQVLAAMLAAQAPERLFAMADMLTDQAVTPESKMAILFSLENVLNPELTNRILDLTKPEVDGMVRAGVTMVLARSDDPAVLVRLGELQNDDDRRVRLGALNALTLRGDEEARARLREMYFEEDLPAPFKERIALTFGMVPQSEDAEVLSDAARLDTLGDDTRMAVVGALAMLQDEKTLPTLRACAEGDYPEDIKALARDAISALESRRQKAAEDASSGEPLPADESAPKQMHLP